jgi:hypothetical protein
MVLAEILEAIEELYWEGKLVKAWMSRTNLFCGKGSKFTKPLIAQHPPNGHFGTRKTRSAEVRRTSRFPDS